MEIDEIKSVLKDSLTYDDTDSVLKQVIKMVTAAQADFPQNLLKQYHEINTAKNSGQIAFDEYNKNIIRIDQALRDWINKLQASDLNDNLSEFDLPQPQLEPSNTVFIATPITKLNDDEFIRLKAVVGNLTKTLHSELGVFYVYYPGNDIDKPSDYLPPETALKQDLQGIRTCEFFILIYPGQFASSAMIQVGLAIALHKKCLFFVHKREDLPYILQSADAVFKFVRIFRYKTLEDIPNLLKEHGLK